MSQKSTKRQWRKLLKKEQRKRKRQKLAKKRDQIEDEEELFKLQDPLYKQRLEQQEQLENFRRLAEEKQHEEDDEQWLRTELLAQKQFRREEQKRLAKEKVEEELRLKQEQRLKEQEETVRRRKEQAAKEFEESMQLLQDYLDDSSVATPPRLQSNLESRPDEKLCEFYSKTNCCRFGLSCVYNHQMPQLSKVLLIKHFFQHSLLESRRHPEYSSAEEHLELSEYDFQDDYREFCADVWPELESFGAIVNFRTVRNKMAHTRGHVFVEYSDKRSALKAFIRLQNRYYASKRLIVEFSHVTHWRSAVCGMISALKFLKGLSLARKCPKGDNCNYLHLMVNPGNKYNSLLEPLQRAQAGKRCLTDITPTTTMSWNDVLKSDAVAKTTRWRWSESPEIELKSYTEETNSLVTPSDSKEEQPSSRVTDKECKEPKYVSQLIKHNSEKAETTSQRRGNCSEYTPKRKHKDQERSRSKDKRNDKHKHHKRSVSKELSPVKRKKYKSTSSKETHRNDKRLSKSSREEEEDLAKSRKHESSSKYKKHKKSMRHRSASKDRHRSPKYRRSGSVECFSKR